MLKAVDYRDVKSISQTSLKELDRNVRAFYNDEYQWLIGNKPRKERRSSDSLILGDMVDCILTRPEELDKKYVVEPDKPSPQMAQFVEYMFDFKRLNPTMTDEEVQSQAYLNVGFKRDSFDKVLERYKTEGTSYYVTLLASSGKTIVSRELYDQAYSIVLDMLEDKWMGPVLRIQHSPELAVIKQMQLYYEVEGVSMKAMLDLVHVDTEKKTVQPYDIKTSGKPFEDSFFYWRYNLQASFYNYMLERFISEHNHWKGYEILPFRFLVGYSNGASPEVWQMQKEHYNQGYSRKGWLDLLNDYKWHVETGNWDYPREVYESQGIRKIRLDEQQKG